MLVKRCYWLVFILSTCITAGFSQQRPQYSQYMTNPFLLNPAVSGTEEYTDIRAGFRKQWTGLEGAPQTMYLSTHTNLGRQLTTINKANEKKNGYHGIGGFVIKDEIGYTTTTSLNLAYSYHLRLSEKIFASIGLMGGINQNSLDRSKVIATNPGDPLISSTPSIGLGDIALGTWIYSDNLYLGASLAQVAPPVDYTQTGQQKNYAASKHYYIMMGYGIPLGDNLQFVPSFCLKGVMPSPMALDLNAKLRYKDFLWAGVSYRSTKAAVAIVGIVINNMLDISYSYDYSTGEINKYAGGSHEVVIGYRLKSKPKDICHLNTW